MQSHLVHYGAVSRQPFQNENLLGSEAPQAFETALTTLHVDVREISHRELTTLAHRQLQQSDARA
jgi:hypothetical protein